jgi:hypothetical protein
MDWQEARTANENAVQIPERWLHLHYYEALNILFRFENALRVFVYVILKRELLDAWDNAAIAAGGTIRSETKKRLTQAKDHGYLGYGVSSPMLFLNSGEILQILTSDAYWKHFARYFKASKSIVETKLQEIGTVRNALAHFRPLRPEDIDLIKQNSRHVLLEVERCLTEITSISDAVPTNSKDAWYTRIMAIRNEQMATSLFSSADQEWIRLELVYKIATLSKEKYGDDFLYLKLSNFKTDRLLVDFVNLKRHCIYVSESEPYGAIHPDESLASHKRISIVFARARLAESLDVIAEELERIARVAKEETTLVSQDNLARGELIEVKVATANRKEQGERGPSWSVNMASTATSLANADHAEYWGQRIHYTPDFIAGTDQYPWMPATISKPSWF